MNVIEYITITCNLKNVKNSPKKSIKINWQSQHDQKIYYSMFNCNQNYYRYKKYYVLIIRSNFIYEILKVGSDNLKF
jgi:hypothetical protein